MEAIVTPLASWTEQGVRAGFKETFQALRSEKGDDMILKNNFFVGTLIAPNLISICFRTNQFTRKMHVKSLSEQMH